MSADLVADATMRVRVPITILGVPFDPVTGGEALEWIGRMIISRRPHYVATANVDFVVQAQEDMELRRILGQADAVLCDGTPLVWASRWLRDRLPERVAGSDLVPLLIQRAAERGYRVFLLGASAEAGSEAVNQLRRRHPGLFVEHYAPPFNRLLEMDHDEIGRRIREARPDILLVSFGCPKQEKWIAMHYRALGVPVSIGVGATIDFLAGRMKRAPHWMRGMGMEWIFRLLQEPRRLCKRYAKDLWVFGGRIAVQWWQLRRRPENASGPDHNFNSLERAADENSQWITLRGKLDHTGVGDHERLLQRILDDGRHCLLEMTGVKFMDSTGAGWLVRLQKKLHDAGRHLILLAPAPCIRRALALMRLDVFFLWAPDIGRGRELIEGLRQEQTEPVTLEAPGRLAWRGYITACNCDEVWAATREHMLSAPGELRIDLAGVRFMDSSGAAVMTRARNLAKKEGLKLSFVHPRSPVRNVLRHGGLEALLPARPKRNPRPGATPPDLVWSEQT